MGAIGSLAVSSHLPVTKPVPSTITNVPPLAGPMAGKLDVTVGSSAYVNADGEVAQSAPLVDTPTSTLPGALPAGVTQARLVGLSTIAGTGKVM